MKALGSVFFLVAVVGAVALMQTPSQSLPNVNSFDLDTAHSAIVFRIKHLGIGYTYGRFNDFSGKLAFTPGGSGSSVAIEVDATSVDTANEKRDNHLRSPDFFSVREFPKIRFQSSEWRRVDDKTYDVTGSLSLHGKSKPVTARVELTGEGDRGKMGYRVGFEAVIDLKRSDFGMTKMIGPAADEVRLIIAVEGVRP